MPFIDSTSKAVPDGWRRPELDGLRAIAILLVLLSHHLAAVPLPGFHHLIECGWIGVDLFFVLSGFLIGGILLDQRAAPNYYRIFYLRRFLRIVPLYALLVVPGLLVVMMGWQNRFPGHSLGSQSAGGLWLCAVFLQNLAPLLGWGVPAYLGPTWSVAVEEQFYLLLPPLVRRLSPARLLKWLVAAILFAPLLRTVLWARYGAAGSLAGYVLLPCRWDALLLGVLAACAGRQPRFMAWFAPRRQGLRRLWWLLALAALASLLAGSGRLDPRLALAGYTLIDTWFTCTLLLAVLDPPGSLRRLLSHPLFQPVAAISYGLYLLQSPVAATLDGLLRHFQVRYAEVGWTATGVALVSLGLTALAAALSYQLLERRCIRFGHRFRYRPSAADATRPPAPDPAGLPG